MFNLMPVRASKRQLADFLRQFSHLIRAKITANEAVKILSGQIENKLFAQMLSDVHFEMLKGRALSDCLHEQKSLPPLIPRMISVGEKSGNLPAVLQALSSLYEKEAEVNSSVKNALIYPVIVIIVMLVSICVSVVLIVPQFANLFALYDADLPLPSRVLIACGEFLTHNFLWLVSAFLCMMIAGLAYAQSKSGKHFIDKALLRLPVIKKTALLGQNAQFAMSLSVCLGSGMIASDALFTTQAALTNTVLRQEAERCMQTISKGQLLSNAFAQSETILPILTNMVRLGESSGDLQAAIHDAAYILYDEFDRCTRDLLKMLEPLLTIMIGLLVAFVMAAIVLPTLTLSALV